MRCNSAGARQAALQRQCFCLRLLHYRRELVAHRSCVHLTQAGGKEHDLTGVQALRMRGAQSRDLPIQS